ncbi:DUF3566 domain-containing protein [Corynebacterium sp. 320]|uniref:DUF3566 domain-containing protein n=1 Tax=Corynebacterium TaxID=1716 RepID=UPI00125CC775|nr:MULTISPECIES: DUF3566 domain-containing protein [Corynebacterium]KAB1502796.1 DUF3566 domain-containing protein [Corynebacterium sp. 320]KAB1550463.1 DUF3566 domain-containing protein [Corynebacterium sp. 319]KAB1554806.1 DUF3566 domain-containing protein [Corynebacterium sp. 321]KAB3526459.1 DUF3566 domain-containing protein [Corynebacterium sp. 250]KAB3539778.1 DUF3566 domain-containing protein [Corynebacterium sp. 366]
MASDDEKQEQARTEGTAEVTAEARTESGARAEWDGQASVPQETRQLTVFRVNPVSALKVGAGFGVALFLVWMIAVTIVWIVLNAAGVWDRLNNLLSDLFGLDTFGPGVYFGLTGLLGVLEVLVVVMLAPLAAVVYNDGQKLWGGLKVELAEDVAPGEHEGADEDALGGVLEGAHGGVHENKHVGKHESTHGNKHEKKEV